MSEKPILFISDLHLQPDRLDICQAFFQFLHSQAVNAQALYILGDFFEVWLGDDHNTALSDQVAEALRSLSAQGVAIRLMHGNRDFLIGETFTQACGGELIHEPFLLKAFDQKVLLMHGDVLCTRDTDYMEFRQMVRNPDWQQKFLALSIKERIAFAEKARAASKSMSSNKADDIMDVTPEAVADVMRQHQVDTLIHGHTHRPGSHNITLDSGHKQRLVLGDWDQSAWYISWTADALTLHQLDLQAV